MSMLDIRRMQTAEYGNKGEGGIPETGRYLSLRGVRFRYPARAHARFRKTAKTREKTNSRSSRPPPRPVQLYLFARSYKVRSALYPSLITHA